MERRKSRHGHAMPPAKLPQAPDRAAEGNHKYLRGASLRQRVLKVKGMLVIAALDSEVRALDQKDS